MATNNSLNINLSGQTGSGNIVGATAPTISNPTVSTGSFTSPSITTPTIANPTVSDGTFTDAILTDPVITGGNLAQPTIEQPKIIGVVTNSTAAAGDVGQIISSVVVSGSAVSLASEEVTPITSISLTAGDWDIWGNVTFISAPESNAIVQTGWIATNNTTKPDGAYYAQLVAGGSALLGYNGFCVPSIPLQLATTTTVYLMCWTEFSGGTPQAYGGIYARRRR